MNERADLVQILVGIVGPHSVLTRTDDGACLATARKQGYAAGDCFILIEATSDPSGLREAALVSAGFDNGWLADGVGAQLQVQTSQLPTLRELSVARTKRGASVKHDMSVPLSALPAFPSKAFASLQDVTPGTRPNLFGYPSDERSAQWALTPITAEYALARNLKAAHDLNGTLSPSKVLPKLAQEK